jgi:hypothetical protein
LSAWLCKHRSNGFNNSNSNISQTMRNCPITSRVGGCVSRPAHLSLSLSLYLAIQIGPAVTSV